ncbi:fukutin [Platysternon megacephalum]|uniref:Fukutin n=1 Tax=Platysternon megacephalum TaxID=55544 RepID=A0A4D9E7L1_9SAUR|nr:fukutin [Platysternon megacephalum]
MQPTSRELTWTPLNCSCPWVYPVSPAWAVSLNPPAAPGRERAPGMFPQRKGLSLVPFPLPQLQLGMDSPGPGGQAWEVLCLQLACSAPEVAAFQQWGEEMVWIQAAIPPALQNVPKATRGLQRSWGRGRPLVASFADALVTKQLNRSRKGQRTCPTGQ